ncbi:MAG: hypothetical protein QM820_29545 [Minicystis sp.]
MSDEVLGNLTAARTRDDEDARKLIAAVTGLGARVVQSRLQEAHGKTLVRTIFDDKWPGDAGSLGELRVKQARDAGLIAEIMGITELSERKVRQQIEGAHGSALIKKVFAPFWPPGDDDDDDDDTETDEASVALGDMTAARVRNSGAETIRKIAELTGHSEATVARRLDDAHGKTRVRNLFEDTWPMSAEQLGGLRARQARDCGLFPEIARVTGLDERITWAVLDEGDGRMAVRNLFGGVWPDENDEETGSSVERDDADAQADEEEDLEGEDEDVALGDMTVARVRDGGAETVRRIAELTGYSETIVTRWIGDSHGATRVRNLFEDTWPTGEDQLGGLRVRQARECGLYPEIARITGQPPQVVQSWLEEGDGRMAVRNLFASVWPSASAAHADEDEDEDPSHALVLDEEDEEIAEDEEEDEHDGDEGDGDEDDAATLIAALRLDPHGRWSRPRQLSRVLRHIGMEVQRLRTPRFQDALQQLAQAGIELRLADDDDDGPLPLDAEAPGIHAKVCLRVAHAVTVRASAPQPARDPGRSRAQPRRRVFIGAPPFAGGLMDLIEKASVSFVVDARFPPIREGFWSSAELARHVPRFVSSTAELESSNRHRAAGTGFCSRGATYRGRRPRDDPGTASWGSFAAAIAEEVRSTRCVPRHRRCPRPGNLPYRRAARRRECRGVRCHRAQGRASRGGKRATLRVSSSVRMVRSKHRRCRRSRRSRCAQIRAQN